MPCDRPHPALWYDAAIQNKDGGDASGRGAKEGPTGKYDRHSTFLPRKNDLFEEGGILVETMANNMDLPDYRAAYEAGWRPDWVDSPSDTSPAVE